MNRHVFAPGIFVAGVLLLTAPGCDKASADANATVASDLAAGKLGGLYVRQRNMTLFMGGRMTFNLVRDYYYFFPDGHVLFGVPTQPGSLKEHPSAEDFAAFKEVKPGERGTYAIADGKITIKPDEGSASTEPFSVPKADDDSVLQIGEPSIIGSVKSVPFADGQKLDGRYTFDGTVGLGTSETIFNVNTLTFRPDGTLGSDQLSGVDVPQATTGGNTTSAGTYKLSGYTLETTIGGKTERQTAFRWTKDEAQPGMLCLAGRVYSRQEK